MTDKTPCCAVVYRRDTYRSTGRGQHGSRFELLYAPGRCKRQASRDGLCWQHHLLLSRGRHVEVKED